MTLYSRQSSNIRRTWLLIGLFLVLVIGIGYVFAQAYGDSRILYFAVGFSIFSSFFSYWFSDKIVLTMSQAKEVSHENAKELYHLVENLCIAAGLPMPKIYVIADSAPNAFATGRNPQHAVIVFTTGILEKLEKVELEGVVAHELSHIGNRDILLSTIVTVLVGVVVLLADWFRHWSFWGGNRKSSDSENSQIQLIFTIVAIAFSLLAPLFAYLMQLAISRKREYLADTSAALLTRYPEGLARALEKLTADTEPLEAANRATAHLYIVSPFKGGKMKEMFSTHPPLEKRIKALRDLKI
ncbi:MAG TPA: M48 family metallopeptidase [bacterium]|nr:M48 family metallopeptidase [bacterium]HPT30109.1 M48 family metallopeptidase [bacterium]